METKQTGFMSLISGETVMFLWITFVSALGGVVSYFNKYSTFHVAKFLAHLSSSAFAGLMTGLLCMHAGVTGPLQYVACGVAAHMGTPAVIKLLMRNRFLKDFFGKDEKDGSSK